MAFHPHDNAGIIKLAECDERHHIIMIMITCSYASGENRLDHRMHRTRMHATDAKLHRVTKKICQHLFVFVTTRAMVPTNSNSERALRPCITFRKITNGFRVAWGTRLSADIRSVIQIGSRCVIDALETIHLTLAGKPFPLSEQKVRNWP
jgi:hypothetical protein